jgi:hypothetical protein
MRVLITARASHPFHREEKVEPPILLFRVAVPTELTLPVDISAFSAFPDEAECLYAPGVHLEQRKEELGFLLPTVKCKIVEVLPSNVGTKGHKLKSAGAAAGAKEDKADTKAAAT